VNHNGSLMPRFSVTLDDSVLNQVDSNARKRRLSRTSYIATAIESSLNQSGSELQSRLHQCESDLNQRDSELNQTRQSIVELENKLMNQIAEKDKIIESITKELNQAMNQKSSVDTEAAQLKLQIEQAADLKNDFDQLKMRYDQSLSDATQRWEETKALKSEITKLKKQLEESQATIQHLKDDLLRRQSETDQLGKTREELVAATTARDKLQEALKVRDDDIAFLRGHLSQLSDKLPKSLPPSEEEAKRKGWWQFWRRD
jgi:chromosome segregation ATPase